MPGMKEVSELAKENSKEILCISSGWGNYALEFAYIIEICRDVVISPVPGLPSYFQGVYNYKGNIIPAAVTGEGKSLILIVVRYGKYQFGLVLPDEARLFLAENADWVDSPADNGGSGVWKEKAVIQCEGELFSLIDVKRTVEDMMGQQKK